MNLAPWPLIVLLALPVALTARAQVNPLREIAPDVYFHEGDTALGHCNNGWVVMDDGVVVIDANYPSGAAIVIPKVKATTSKPVRFVIDTHFHPDHSFGNRLWADLGAVIVAQSGTLDELRKSGQAAWEASAATRPDVAASHLKLPDVIYSDFMAFDDGRHRVELRWPGVAHTRGDTLVWLPREKILFTGDVCVNGAYNYIHDSDVDGWIKALEAAKTLGAVTVCPGHGPMGGPEIIADQQGYFIELRRGVRALLAAKRTPAEVKAAVHALGADLRKIAHIARYVPTDFWLTAQVEKIYGELGGAALPK
jgi:glyoxylase-like metal-dependent hydrolase (beta-lactamase superfamily II)